MSELHKPGTPGPWKMQHVKDGPQEYWLIYPADDSDGLLSVGEVDSHLSDAAAIADLWGWIARAERFEEALREIAGSTDAIADLWQIAADALRDEGRL